MFSIFCLSKTSVKIHDAKESRKSSKPAIMCGLCSAEKNIITLDCKHKCCVRCFHKAKLCTQCEKEKSRCFY